MKNEEIRTALKEAGLKQWELADMMDISEFTLSRKLRSELPEDMKQHLLELIHEHQEGGEQCGTMER